MVRESNPKEFGVALFFLPHFCFCAGGRGLRQDGMKLQKGICRFLALQVVTVLAASNPFSPGCLFWAWAVPLGPGYVRRKEEKCGNGVGGESGDQEEDRPQVPPPRGGNLQSPWVPLGTLRLLLTGCRMYGPVLSHPNPKLVGPLCSLA